MRDTFEISFTDFFLWIGILVLVLVIMVCAIAPNLFKKTINPLLCMAIGTISSLLYSLLNAAITLGYYIICTIREIVETTILAFNHLPITWYVMASLTVVPMCCNIARSGVVIYLAAYCATAWFICICLPTVKKPPLVDPHNAKSQSLFFTGMKITIN